MRVLVIGSGIMGNGIAQVCAMSGHETTLQDISGEQLEKARAAIETSLARFERKGRIDADGVEQTWSRLTLSEDLGAAAAGAEAIVEAVPEKLELKRDVVAAAAAAAEPDALLGEQRLPAQHLEDRRGARRCRPPGRRPPLLQPAGDDEAGRDRRGRPHDRRHSRAGARVLRLDRQGDGHLS